MKSFLKFICEMPMMFGNTPIADRNQRNTVWSTLLQKAKDDGFEFGTRTIRKLNGLTVNISNGNNNQHHVLVNDEENYPHGYLRLVNRGDHFQVVSMMKNPSASSPMHSEILHHLSRELESPIVSDYKQTEGAKTFWNRVARTHGGVSMIKKGQKIPYDPNTVPSEEVWGDGEDQQDTLLAVEPDRKKQ